MSPDATLNKSHPLVEPYDSSSSGRPRVLYLVHRTPYPPNRGDRIRSFHILTYLAERSDVYLAALADEPVPDADTRKLRGICKEVQILPQPSIGRWRSAALSFFKGKTATQGLFRSPGLTRVVRNWAKAMTFDAVLACCSSMGQYLLLPELRSTPSIVDLIDVDSQKWFDYAQASRGPKAVLYRREGIRLRALEAELTDHAQAVLLVNEQEAELFRRVVPNQKTVAVPNGVAMDYFYEAPPVPPDVPLECVFVGVLDYRPNVDGLHWFCTEVWPMLREQHPEARLSIVGRRPADRVLQLGRSAGVAIVGEVPDVRPYVERATVSIAPLQIARGTQNKVLEAMAMRKAVVATPQALEGIDATDGEHLMQASSATDWVQAITRLAHEADLREQLGTQARDFVQQHHNWSACLAPIGQFIATGNMRVRR